MEHSCRKLACGRPALLLLLLLLLRVSACFGTDTAPRSNFDTYTRTPPRFGSIAPRTPFNSFYRQYPSYGYHGRYPSGRHDLPEGYYNAYRPAAAYPFRRNYYNNEYGTTLPYTGHPLRDELKPPVYNPYFYPYQRADRNERPYGDVYASYLRFRDPYFRTRYFEQFRPPWQVFNPSSTYFQATQPSYSGAVSLPPRLYYPHFLHTTNTHGLMMSVLNENRKPGPDQFLLFIPDMAEINQPGVMSEVEIERPSVVNTPLVFQEEIPQEMVVDKEPGVTTDTVMTPEDLTVPNDTDSNQSEGGNEDIASHATQEKPASEAMIIIYPTPNKDSDVDQSQHGNEASTESVFSPNESEGETSTEDMIASTIVVDSSVNSTQAPEAEIAVTTNSQESHHNEENLGEITTTESEEAEEEEYPEFAFTEIPEPLGSPEAQLKPENENEELTPEEIEDHNIYEVTESLINDTTQIKEENEEIYESKSSSTEKPATTTGKAVYVQMHLLAQDNSSTPSTAPVVDREETSTRGNVPENTSESSVFFLGEMHNDEPSPSHDHVMTDQGNHDRIYKRYSESKSKPILSLDFKTGHLVPSFV